jgi:HD-GYP domain-containing protein (c-di-GMP phosphodiesterase class II)
MKPLKLLFPVRTLDNEVLLPAGTELTDEVMDELIASNNENYRSFTLLEYGSVKEDVNDFLAMPPYNVIFDDQEAVVEVLHVMNSVELVEPVFATLEYFKSTDFHTYRHMLMIFALTTLLSRDLVEDMRLRLDDAAAGPTHDFGKICVPLDVLLKKTPLTSDERNILRHHTVAGYVLLCYYFKDKDCFAGKLALNHHERRDGSGYPRGINDMSRLMEIVAACDVYDALISPRPYRVTSYNNRTALEIITEMAEKGQVGWDVIKALVAYNRKLRPGDDVTVSVEKRGVHPEGNAYGKTIGP